MPAPERADGRWLRALERVMAAQAVWAFRRPWLALAVTLVLSAVAWAGSGRLRVEPSMTELLPESFESVQQTRELGRRLGGIGYVAVVVEGAPVEVLEQVAEELAPRLEALPSIRYVETGPATRFFEERALYYLSTADLADLDAQLQERIDWEKLHKNPLYVDLEGEEPPVVDFEALRAKLGSTREPRAAYYVDPEALRLVVLAKPNQLASDMRFSRQVVGEVQGVLHGIDAASYAPGLRLTIAGRYQKKVDLQDVVQADLKLASLLSLGLVLGYLLLHFRRPGALLQLLAPLLLGLLWTYGLAGWLFGTLNILTAFVGVILLGLGIDNGIHFLSRYLDERRAGHPAGEAIGLAFGRTGRAALAATLTTVASFASLMVSDFRAFRELGVLAGGGLLLVFLAYTLAWPALEALLPLRVHTARRERIPHLVDGLLGGAPWVFWSGMLLAFALFVNAGQLRFNDDFAALEPHELPAYWLDAEVNRLLGRSQTPLVFLTNDAASARAVSGAVRGHARELGHGSGVDRVLSLFDLVPAEQGQAEQILHRMASKLDAIAPESITPELKTDFERLREMTSARPFGRSELPASVRRAFEGEGGALGEFVLVFPRVSMSDGAAVRALAAELSQVPAGPGKVMSAAGEAMVLADVLDTVFAQTPRSVLLALLTVGLVLWLTLGSVRLAALAGASALLSLGMTLGLMPLLGIELNYLNVIIFPALIGMGVDGGAHLLVHLEEGKSLRGATWRIGLAVSGSLITTALGFAALLVARHPGLRSLAQVAVLGLSLNLLVTVVLLPAMLALFPSARRAVRCAPGGVDPVRGASQPASRPSGVVAQVATCFGAGQARWAPGSLGALLALPAGWLMRELSGTQRLLLIAALTLASTLAVHRYLAGRARDPQEVVVDEWIGCLITLAFVPFSAGWVVAGYLLFRMFDILKPGPIRWLDRRVHGGVGVMADDVAAGLAAGAVLALARLAALG